MKKQELKKFKEYVEKVEMRVHYLEIQAWCGAAGHRISIHLDMRSPGYDPPRIGFKCTLCHVDYQRRIENLTPKEKVLLAAYDAKD